MTDSTSAILAERQKTHGDYTDHAAVTQQLKRIMREHDGWLNLSQDKRETLEMIAHKIGRILAGNPEVEDHWADIAGYARLSADRVAQRLAPK
jgi:hypothetical protein